MKTGYDNWKTTPPDYYDEVPSECYCNYCNMIHEVKEFNDNGECIYRELQCQ